MTLIHFYHDHPPIQNISRPINPLFMPALRLRVYPTHEQAYTIDFQNALSMLGIVDEGRATWERIKSNARMAT